MRYDANGNQVEISNVRYHWTNGRQLSAVTYIDDDGAEQPLASYTYDDNGIRTSKTYGDTTTYYTNVDGAITSQYCLDGYGAVTDLMQFLYDGSNELLGFTYNNNTYFYVKNLQGDVVAVIDSTGTEKAVYEYGTYGTLIYSGGDLADVNPMRYRGYYYDSDAGMYYLQSRYYAPEFAKFINSDLPEYAQQQKADHYGTNLFAYCCNDPVNNSDPTGCWKKGKHKSITYDIAKKYFTKNVAKKIAEYCKKLDEDFPSTAYAKNFTLHAEEKEWQYYHFNKYKYGNKDSRTEYANKWLSKAIDEYHAGRHDKAYMWLGYALHCLQDIEAHGQIDRGDTIPDHLGNVNGDNRNKADKASGYEWTDSKKNKLKYVFGSKKRQNAAKEITKTYIKAFRDAIK